MLAALSNIYAQNIKDQRNIKIYQNHLPATKASTIPTVETNQITQDVPSLCNIILAKLGHEYAVAITTRIENNEKDIDPINLAAPSRRVFKKYIDAYRTQNGMPIVAKSIYKLYTKDYLTFLIDEVGADVNQTDSYGKTALFHSYTLTIAQQLIDAGADVNHKNIFNQTPLHKISNNCIANLLITNKAKLNELDFFSNSPLHHHAQFSCFAHHLDTTKILIQTGAKTDQQNYNKQTALHLAMASKYASIKTISLFINAGASVILLDHNGKTAIEAANNQAKCRAYHQALKAVQCKESNNFSIEDSRSQQLRNHEKHTHAMQQQSRIKLVTCAHQTTTIINKPSAPVVALSGINPITAVCQYNRQRGHIKMLKKNNF
jgi:hypothetical protein